MLERNSINVLSNARPQFALQKWEPAGRISDFGIFFFRYKPTRTSIVLNIEWQQFVLPNCKLLNSVRGLYDKNSALQYCFAPDVMYKKYERLVFTPPPPRFVGKML